MSYTPVMPSEVPQRMGAFDRFAERASVLTSRPWFFIFCTLLVLAWGVSIFAIRDVEAWQVVISTVTSVVTFLLVALIQNTQTRADYAVQHKLNAIAASLADLMHERGLEDDAKELRSAVGLEEVESTSDEKGAD